MGKVPKVWKLKRLKYFSNCYPSNVDKQIKKGEKKVQLCNYTDVYYHMYITASLDFMTSTATQSEIKKFSLKKGDIVLTKDSETPDDIAIATYVNECIENLLCGYHLTIIKIFNYYNSLYYYFLVSSTGIRNYFENQANGVTRFGLSIEKIKYLLLCIPTINEQQNIANFLNNKTAQFDSIIQKKEQMIQKLEEAKKSLISEVVTGKVKVIDGELVERDPSEMKESGIEWLGMVPKDWMLTSIKYYFKTQLGKMLQPNKKRSGDLEKKYLCTINTDWVGVKTEVIKTMWFNKGEFSSYQVNNGDLIVNEGGDAGKACIIANISENLYIQNAVHRIRPKKHISNKFLYYWLFYLKSIEFIELICNKATIMHLTSDKLNNLIFLGVNSSSCIKDIVDFLDRKVEEINITIEKQKSLISKLKQAKQSLISEAVTGKIDLRDWKIVEKGEVHDFFSNS